MKPRTFSTNLGLSVFLFALWVLLTGSVSREEMLAGLLVSVVVTTTTARTRIFTGFVFNRRTSISVLRYLAYFMRALIEANLDMARRVLSPSLPLRPDIVEVKTGLSSDLGKLLLANSITLTPGTLTVDVLDDRLLVHWVDSRPGTDLQHATQAIAAGFENHIRGFLK